MEWFFHTKGGKITSGDLQKLVSGQIPSHQHLHYIDGSSFSQTDAYIGRLAKLVAAMANSGGGIIILGIKPSRNKAKAFTALREPADTGIIHHHLIANISPFPEGMLVENIAIESKGFCLVIRIPAGNGPFMFSDYRYYAFRNHKAIKLEADDVSALYNKPAQKHLEIYSIYNTQGVPELKDGKFTIVRFYPKVLIRNTGEAMEKDYKMEISLPAGLYEENTMLRNHFSHHEGKYVVFSFAGKSPVFSTEIHKMLDFSIRVSSDSIEIFENEELHFRLYYSAGVHRQSYPLKELFTYQGKMLSQGDF
ncbi:MAG: RNA-binding domain-containing protein, partial [Bacteroidota bacterium]